MNITFISTDQELSQRAVQLCGMRPSRNKFRCATSNTLDIDLNWSDWVYALDEESVDEIMNRTGIMHIDKIRTLHVRNPRLLDVALKTIQ